MDQLVGEQARQKKSEDLKSKGNQLYRNSDFAGAIECYEEAYYILIGELPL